MSLENKYPQAELQWLQKGTSQYRCATMALFLAGFATFALLYCVQPLLEEFATTFRVSAAESSLAMSVSTGFLAVSIFFAGPLSEALGRKGLMLGALSGAASLNILAGMMPDWHGLLIARAVEGFVLGGVPAVAMAYIAEEIDPDGLGLTMGVYVSGTALGGMVGRVTTSILADYVGWKVALSVIGGMGFIAAAVFVVLLPKSRNFVRRPGVNAAYHIAAWKRHLTHRGLPLLFILGAFAMGAFVTVYNYSDFYLSAAPFNLSSSESGLIFLVYIFGVCGSSFAGGLSDKLGRGPVLLAALAVVISGVCLTLVASLVWVIMGVAMLTFGFFAAHSVTSSWVGGLGGQTKGHASSLYLLSYYMGSSVMGTLGGYFWAIGRWPGVIAFVLVLLGGAFVLACTVQIRTKREAETVAVTQQI